MNFAKGTPLFPSGREGVAGHKHAEGFPLVMSVLMRVHHESTRVGNKDGELVARVFHLLLPFFCLALLLWDRLPLGSIGIQHKIL